MVGTAVEDGRLHLCGAVLLAPHLTVENAEDLVAEASGKSKAEIEVMLVRRAPRPDVPERLEELVGEERRLTAAVLAHLGEVEARRLYLPAACSSMHVSRLITFLRPGGRLLRA